MEPMPQDRRLARSARVLFESLVVLSGASQSSAYECETLDISEEGARVRTAYLLPIGERVTLRLAGGAEEIAAEGQIVWREEAPRGGDMGIHFTRIDERSLLGLRELCGIGAPPPTPSEVMQEVRHEGPVKDPIPPSMVPAPPSMRSESVRLHLGGVSAPLSATLRTDANGDVLVGSQLRALKVGHEVQVEDVHGGRSRVAFIDKVDVQVNRETKVPELVVGLKFQPSSQRAVESSREAGQGSHGAAKGPLSPQGVGPRTGSAREDKQPRESKMATSEQGDMSKATRGTRASAQEEASKPSSAAGASGEGASVKASVVEEQEKPGAPSALEKVGAGLRMGVAGAWDRSKELAVAARSVFGAGASSLGAAARLAVKAIQARRKGEGRPSEELEENGASLQSSHGESAMNEQEENQESSDSGDFTPRRALAPRVMAVGGAATVALMIGIFALRGRAEGSPPGVETVSALDAAASSATARARQTPSLAGVSSAGGDSVVANVPLFGPTALSTTEPVAAASVTPPPTLIAGPVASGLLANSESFSESSDVPPEKGRLSFGRGEVVKPRILRLKMDAPIADVRGSVAGNTVTLTIPGRKNVESAKDFLKRDKRLSNIKAVQNPDGVQVVMSFKEVVPGFLAKADGKMLEIELSRGEKHSEGEDPSTEHHHGATASKHSTSSKHKHHAAKKHSKKE